MTTKTDQKKQRRTFQGILNQRQPVRDNFAGTMGDGLGNLHVAGKPGYIYVTIGGISYKSYCDRVAPQYGKNVWVGVSNEGGKGNNFYQVLSVRAISSADNSQIQSAGYAPAKRYEYMALGGGQDPLSLQLRAWVRLRIGMSAIGGMNVNLLGGFVKTSAGRVLIAKQDIDLTAHIPATAHKAAYVLITIDDTGAVVQTKGAEVDIDVLANSDIPDAPAGTIEECGAVRVYYGQTLVREGRINTDIVDTRFLGINRGSVPPIADPLYVRKLEKSAPPTVNDDISMGYLINDLWHDAANRAYYICHNNVNGAADWFDFSAGSGGGHVVQNNGVNQIQRANLNFIGATIEDNGSDATVVTITGSGGSSSPALNIYLAANFT